MIEFLFFPFSRPNARGWSPGNISLVVAFGCGCEVVWALGVGRGRI